MILLANAKLEKQKIKSQQEQITTQTYWSQRATSMNKELEREQKVDWDNIGKIKIK